MKKIGVITINDFNNYGNRLQCYAVQEYLKKLNFDVSNIYNINYTKTKIYTNKVKFYVKLIIQNKQTKILYPRKRLFNKFNKYIKFSNVKIYNNKFTAKLNNKYDYFVVGSDQVWNPYFSGEEINFLPFVENNKKISFAASIGTDKLEKEFHKKYTDYLKKFKAISVREEAGKNIIEKLTNRKDIRVLIDPTMLLTSNDWDKISRKPKQLKKYKNQKYILNYFLGEMSEERKKEIEKIAKENDCFIINILDKTDPFYVTGPSEFLYLEKNAFLICTDSFHSSVFGILYNTPFIVFDREQKGVESMNSRIDTLLSKFNLEDRKFNEKITKKQLECNYSDAYKILEKEREKALKFLKKALDINE